MDRYLVSFDLVKPQSPPEDLYSSIYRDIRKNFGPDNYHKKGFQLCLVRSDLPVAEVKSQIREIILRKSNRFSSMNLVVASLGNKISISRGKSGNDDISELRTFFVDGMDK